jgi:site-specific recombinase XerD
MEQLRAWMLGHDRGDDVPSTQDLRHWLAELQESEATGATLARKRSSARHFFDFLVTAGIIRESPVEALGLPSHEYELPQTLSRQQITALLQAAQGNQRDYTLLHVLVGCGLRVSEVCALNRSQIDLQNHVLYVAGRVVPIPDTAFPHLDAWLQEHSESLVFPIKQRMVRVLCEKYRERAGIPIEVKPSLLRHTSAVWQLVDGADPEILRTQLGHDRDDVMVRYIERAHQLADNEARSWQQTQLL